MKSDTRMTVFVFYFVASRELGCLTSEWFYQESSKKYKRCGSAKVVRELHRRGTGAGKCVDHRQDSADGTSVSDRYR